MSGFSFIKFTIYLVGRNISYFSQEQHANEWEAPRVTDASVSSLSTPQQRLSPSHPPAQFSVVISTKSCHLLFSYLAIILVSCYKSFTYQKHAKNARIVGHMLSVSQKYSSTSQPKWTEHWLAGSIGQSRWEGSIQLLFPIAINGKPL